MSIISLQDRILPYSDIDPKLLFISSIGEAKEADLKEMFPMASDVTVQTRKDGKSSG